MTRFCDITIAGGCRRTSANAGVVRVNGGAGDAVVSGNVSTNRDRGSCHNLIHTASGTSGTHGCDSYSSLLLNDSYKTRAFPCVSTRGSATIFRRRTAASGVSRSRLFCYGRQNVPARRTINLVMGNCTGSILGGLPVRFTMRTRGLLDISLRKAMKWTVISVNCCRAGFRIASCRGSGTFVLASNECIYYEASCLWAAWMWK